MISEQSVAAARSVMTVHEHFVRFKQIASEMSQEALSSDRGYFTPSEDEEVRHLLVSYWQSRNALLEVVLEMKDQRDNDDAFLAGYAGALVLADAAQFLFSKFDDRPVVRGKLNEPAPHFGIPEGVYEKVQASRTNPVRAWHLYHSARYFAENMESLRRLAESTPLEPLVELVVQLQNSAQVSLDAYAVQSTRVQARRLVDTVRGDLLHKAVYGLQKSVSSLVSDVFTVRGHKPGLPPELAESFTALLRPGDVLIVRKEHALTNYFLPGYWPHAALYLGSCEELDRLGLASHEQVRPHWEQLQACDLDEPRRVNEAMKDGVRIRSLASPFKSDAITVLRPRLDEKQVAEALARSLFHTGKSYDFDFDFTRSDRLVCTEVVYRAYEGVGDVCFDLTRRAGRLTLSAEDLIGMAVAGQHFDPVAVFAPPDFPDLKTGAEAAEVLRQTAASLS